MTTELVLLNEVPVVAKVHHRVYVRLGMMGEMFKWLDDQSATLHDESGWHIPMVYTPMVIRDA